MRRIKFFINAVLLLAAVAVLLPLCSHGTPPTPQEGTRVVRVLTYNTHRMGMFRKTDDNQVINYLRNGQDADIICLQEVEVYKDPQYLTLQELKKALGGKYPYSYFDFSVYNSRRQFGNVVFSRYPLINKQTIRYPSRSNISSQCDVVIPSDRAVRVVSKEGQGGAVSCPPSSDGGNSVTFDTIRLITNHLESNRFGEDDFEELKQKYSVAHAARMEQAKCVREAMDASPYPLIVVGDFNDLPLSSTYWKIRGADMRDAFLCTSWGRYGATLVKGLFAARIDYILCSRALQPLRCTTDCVPYSDHYPLQAVIAY
ncbi:MAG: endonuclease/exonuclease/phosphatase family protein [Paludibacteraceae bacterium]